MVGGGKNSEIVEIKVEKGNQGEAAGFFPKYPPFENPKEIKYARHKLLLTSVLCSNYYFIKIYRSTISTLHTHLHTIK